MKNYTVDEQFFSIPNEINSYWAGFWAADGCVGNDYQNIITLSNKDYDHLCKFKKYSKITKEVRVFSKTVLNLERKYCSMSVYSKQWKEDLLKNFNITPRKTFSYIPPKLPSNLLDQFIVGYIDGDGSIVLSKDYKISLSVVGTLETVTMIRNRIRAIIDLYDKNSSCGTIVKTKSVYMFRISHHPAKIALQYFNSVAKIKLERKWDKVSKCTNSSHIKYDWSDKEIEMLVYAYQAGLTTKQIQQIYFPNRTILSIKCKINLLRNQYNICYKKKQTKWSLQEEMHIRQNYNSMSYKEIQEKFLPNRSPAQVESKINRMRITKRKK